jgi:hypothetical protein
MVLSKSGFGLVGAMAMVALGMVALAGHNHSHVALLQDGGKLNAFLHHAESEMNQL